MEKFECSGFRFRIYQWVVSLICNLKERIVISDSLSPLLKDILISVANGFTINMLLMNWIDSFLKYVFSLENINCLSGKMTVSSFMDKNMDKYVTKSREVCDFKNSITY